MADVTKLTGYAVQLPVDAGEVGTTKLTGYAVQLPVDAGEVGTTKLTAYVIQTTATTTQQPRLFIVT